MLLILVGLCQWWIFWSLQTMVYFCILSVPLLCSSLAMGSSPQRFGCAFLVAPHTDPGLFWCELVLSYRLVCRESVSVSSCFRICRYSGCRCSCYFGIRVGIRIDVFISICIHVGLRVGLRIGIHVDVAVAARYSSRYLLLLLMLMFINFCMSIS